MGGSSKEASAKKCVIETPIYKEHLGKLLLLTNAIEKLAKGIAKDSLSAKTILAPLPIEFKSDPSAILLPTDSLALNAVTRYNGFVGFFAQLDKDKRLDAAGERLDELIQMRETAMTSLANLCI